MISVFILCPFNSANLPVLPKVNLVILLTFSTRKHLIIVYCLHGSISVTSVYRRKSRKICFIKSFRNICYELKSQKNSYCRKLIAYIKFNLKKLLRQVLKGGTVISQVVPGKEKKSKNDSC